MLDQADSHTKCNVLMCMEVVSLMVRRTAACGFVRSAGHVGVRAYDELCDSEFVHVAVVVPSTQLRPDIGVVRAPIRATSTSKGRLPKRACVAVWERALRRLGIKWNMRTFAGKVEYHWDGNNIPAYLLAGCTQIQQVAIVGTDSCVTTVGCNFLGDCIHISTMDLESIAGVQELGVSFLSRTGLRSLRLDPLAHVSVIGSGFLAYNRSLTHLDVGPLQRLSVIPTKFLFKCTSLVSVENMSRLTNVNRIEHEFLSGCVSLRTVDLSGLSNVTRVGDRFMMTCTGLVAVDLSPFACSLLTLGSHFLVRCTSIKDIDLAPLGGLRCLGTCFLERCTSIGALDFSPLTQISHIGARFLADSTNLHSVILPPLVAGATVNYWCLGSCSSLQTIDLGPFSNATSIGGMFAAYCTSLTRVDLSPLTNLRHWGESQFKGCPLLEAIDETSLREAVAANSIALPV